LEAGYAESGRVVAKLIERARSLGIELRERLRFSCLDEGDGRMKGIVLQGGQRIRSDFRADEQSARGHRISCRSHESFFGRLDNQCFISSLSIVSCSRLNVFQFLARIFARRAITGSRSIVMAL